MPSYPSSLKPSIANLNGLAPGDDVKALIAQGDNTTLSKATSYTDQEITKITNRFLGGEVNAALDSFFELAAKLDADDDITAQILRDLAAKVDATTYSAFVQSVNTALANKADTNHSHSDYALKSSYDSFVTQTNSSLGQKVDKEAGKGLSTNDFTTSEKTKLAKLVDSYVQNQLIQVDANGNLVSSGTTLAQLASDIATAGTNSLNSAKTYADQKYNQLKTELMGGDVSAALDTFKEIQTWIEADETATAGMLETIAAKVDRTVYDAFVTATTNNLAAKADKTAFDNFAAATNTALASKVNAESGKGLSSNDYTTAEKTAVATIGQKQDATQVQAAIDARVSNSLTHNALLVADANGKAVSSAVTVENGNLNAEGTLSSKSFTYINVANWARGSDANSEWVQINTNVPSNQFRNFTLDIISNSLIGIRFRPIRVEISIYRNEQTNRDFHSAKVDYSFARISNDFLQFKVLTIENKFAIALRGSIDPNLKIDLHNYNRKSSHFHVAHEEVQGWTIEPKTNEEINALVDDSTFESHIVQNFASPISTQEQIESGDESSVVSAAHLKALKDSLHIWELSL